jgi:DGQHR domain-containing protein
MVSERSARAAEYKKRKARHALSLVKKDEVNELLAKGWSQVKELKTGVRLRKEKSVDELLENDFWSILYLFGYPNINSGRRFTIEITEHGGHKVTKQIDVFAYDDETVIVAECKACQVRTKRPLRKDLGEFEANKGPIARAIRQTVGEIASQKIIWMFVTRNIDWAPADKSLAHQYNIKVATEVELRYFSEIAKRLGPAGRFQFHATFLAKAKVDSLRDVKVAAISTKIGGTKAYFFVAPAKKLLPVSYVNHRDIRDPEAAPSYQRLITRNRLQQVAKFIGAGGYFANAIIVNFHEAARFERAGPETEDGTTIGMLYLPSSYKSVWVIDGQHRLYGYAELDEDDPSHRVPVIAFEKMTGDEEGRLFKTINSEQRKVSPGLLDELQGEQDLHSEDKHRQIRAIAARIIDQLRSDVGGPFEDRFKSADLPDGPDRTLTLTSITNAIVASGLIGRFRTKPERFLQGPLSGDKPALTVNVATSAIADYFDMIRQANPARWDNGKAGLLCTNVGVEAYIRLFGELCSFIHKDTGNDARELSETELLGEIRRYVGPLLKFVTEATEEQFVERFKVPFGSGGPARYFFRLSELVRTEFPKFAPAGLDDFLRATAEETTQRADRQIRIIQEEVPAFVVKRLKEVFPGDDRFLQRAVKNQEILVSAFKKQADAPPDEQGPLETYIDFIDFKKIVETKENWPKFSEDLNIRLPEESHAARYIKWFDEINRLRRISAHPFGKQYKDSDIEILECVCDRLFRAGVITNYD